MTDTEKLAEIRKYVNWLFAKDAEEDCLSLGEIYILTHIDKILTQI